jgi:hypothetical protein
MKKIISLLLISTFLFAGEIGTLIYKQGLVKVQHQHSIRKKSLKLNDKILNGDKISTYDSIATIELNDKSIIKLDKYSTIKFDNNKFKQENGKIYYKITKRKQQTLKVATLFTTIGVKGTIFIVDADKTKMVALKRGLVSLTAPKGKYEIHKKKLVDEYEAFKMGMNNEFNEYKKDLYKEFIEYKKSFDLKQNFMVTFDGNKAYEKKLNPKEFDYFENNFK